MWMWCCRPVGTALFALRRRTAETDDRVQSTLTLDPWTSAFFIHQVRAITHFHLHTAAHTLRTTQVQRKRPHTHSSRRQPHTGCGQGQPRDQLSHSSQLVHAHPPTHAHATHTLCSTQSQQLLGSGFAAFNSIFVRCLELDRVSSPLSRTRSRFVRCLEAVFSPFVHGALLDERGSVRDVGPCAQLRRL